MELPKVYLLQACALALALGSPAAWAQSQAGVTAIRGARILTVTRGEIPSGVIVMKGGKILGVGLHSAAREAVVPATDAGHHLTGEALGVAGVLRGPFGPRARAVVHRQSLPGVRPAWR